MSASWRLGMERMRELALDFPAQLEAGYRTGRGLDVQVPHRIRSIVVAGIGGSAIAGDLLAGLTDAETERTISVVRGPILPRAIDSTALVVVTSYSGNTWESLAAYEEAGQRGAPRVVVSSGGEISSRAARDSVPCLVVPPGLPPRSAVGYLFGGLLGVVDPIFPESNEARLARAVSALERRRRALGAPTGPPDRLARRVGSRSPFVYAETGFAGVARRWKTQIEENAKRLAFYDQIPELFHNALVPWDALRPADAARRAVVLLETGREDPRVTQRFRYLERLLRSRRVVVSSVALDGEDRLASTLFGVWWGDLFSLALAARDRVDPYPVHAIETMKRKLGSV